MFSFIFDAKTIITIHPHFLFFLGMEPSELK